jgi:glucosyl-3-phosphoglycerate synthase
MTLLAPAPSVASLKAASGLRVTVCIPARNEAVTVGSVVAPVASLLDQLVDELIVVDDCSTDGTGPIAEAFGARVVRRDTRPGKGAAMAAGLAESTGDIVVFLDADVRNFGMQYVTRLVEPLVADPSLLMVKGTYRRPGEAGGGRVTELLARPLLRRLFPELASVRQPLAGEVAVRRSALDGLVLEPGYGVEVGMLLDVALRFGPTAIAQADLGERFHRNRPLSELAGQADEVLDAILSRVGRPLMR